MDKSLTIVKLIESYIFLFEKNNKKYLKISYDELPNIYSDKRKIINDLIDIEDIISNIEDALKEYFEKLEDIKEDENEYLEDVEEIFINCSSEEIMKTFDENCFSNRKLNDRYNDDEDDDE
jgi:threonyl-tRNA synthetase